jgi:hypothetical protein
MEKKQLKKLTVALSGAFVLGFGANALADSTFDLVQALVSKGVLTEEEAMPLLKGREADIKSEDKKIKKGRVSISDAIDNAQVYGDIRARYEFRKGEDDQAKSIEQERTRTRYKLTMGVKTEAGDFYSDLAFAMGSGGRSDNATFGSTNGANNKDALFVKRAMLGWNATDWLTLEAGRIANPLYTTAMVWDGDLTVEGLAEKMKFNVGSSSEVFFNLFQAQYEGDRRVNSDASGTVAARSSNELFAFQGGAKVNLSDTASAKAAVTYYKYSNDKIAGIFTPAVGNGSALGTNPLATNDLQIIEIPAEISFKTDGFVGYKVFGDYAYNIDGDDRYKSALANSTGATKTAIQKAGNDDKAWMIGVGVDSKQGKEPKKGDWSAKLWYQDVGVYSLDPNTPDSDFFDSRVNMKGVVLKGEYNLRDNVFVNLAAGKAKRKNSDISAVGSGNDISLNVDDFQLYQLDLTYKF